MSENRTFKSSLLRIMLHPAVIAVFGVVTALVGWQAIHESKDAAPVYSNRETQYEIAKRQADLADQLQKLQSQNDDLRIDLDELNERLCAAEKKIGKKHLKQSADLSSPPRKLVCKP